MVAINKQLIYNSNRVSRMTKLKEKSLLTARHKVIALEGITNDEIRAVIEVL